MATRASPLPPEEGATGADLRVLHPDAAAHLERLAGLELKDVADLGAEAARAQALRIRAALPPPRPECPTTDRVIDGPGGALPVRLYHPPSSTAPPLLVLFHGGGWVTGDIDGIDAFARMLAREAGCLVVAGSYRLAPENRYPAAFEDALAVTQWAAAQAMALGCDPQQIAVGGISAGANLAAAVALYLRDTGGPRLACQLLVVPALDADADSPSYAAAHDAPGMGARAMRWFWSQYLARNEDRADPFAAPARAADFGGLPPAIIQTVEHDPLRDEGRAYASALARSGVSVRYYNYQGMLHTFRGAQANIDAVAALRELLNPSALPKS
jgi:acetyl esterase